jgi:uncharacterized protein (TIGR02145 family)
METKKILNAKDLKKRSCGFLSHFAWNDSLSITRYLSQCCLFTRLLIICSLVSCHSFLQAQVTIGGINSPAAGAILDLNNVGGKKGGLILSNVPLTDLEKIPNNFGGVNIPVDKQDVNYELRGAIIYNTNSDPALCIVPGIYVWTGNHWENVGNECNGILYYGYGDCLYCYKTHVFGDAGEWMVENLATTKKPDGTALNFGIPGSINNGIDISAAKAGKYGLLYNWNIVMNGETGDNVAQNAEAITKSSVRGICPPGWVIPSDKDWNDLTLEFVQNYGAYSTNNDGTSYGKSMKSPTDVNPNDAILPDGLSNTDGRGFNGLLVGILSVSMSQHNFGEYSYFWTSTYNPTSQGGAPWSWGLQYNRSNMVRNTYYAPSHLSVRCKKQ